MEKFKEGTSHGRGGKRKIAEDNSSKITSFFTKRTCVSTPRILPVLLDESSVDVDDAPSPALTTSLMSASSQVASNLILDNVAAAPGISSLSQKKRYYREEWKIVKEDKLATEDRIKNLVIDPKEPWGMWCIACTQFAPDLGSKYITNFVKDFPQFNPPRPKKETVNSHFSSKAHKICSEKSKVSKESLISAPIYLKLTEIDPETFKKMTNIMRIVYYFAMKDRAAKEFSSECELQKLNGVNLGNTYQNIASFTVLLKYVAMSFQQNIIDVVNKAKFFSVMTDGSTTKKSNEYEAVVIRHMNLENSSITNSFIGLCKVENSNAAGLANIITKCLDDAGLINWDKKLICMTLDGAAVNVGKHNGLVKLIDSPIHIHCFNHVLDLCLKDTIKENVHAMKAVTFIKTISSFYRSSPKLTRELFRAGEALEIKLVSFKPVCETRWADSLESAVTAVTRNYIAVVQHLTDIVSEHSVKYTNNIKSTAKNLLQDLTTYEIIRFFFAFSDYVSLFSNASKYLETADVDIVQSEKRIKDLQMDLLKFGAFGELKSSVLKNLATFMITINDSDDDITFHGIILQKEKSKRNCSSTKVQDYFKQLCIRSSEIVKTRFSSNDKNSSIVLQTAKIFNTAYFPQTLPKTFGESEITEFCRIFNIATDNAIMEWREFREILSEHFRPEISLKNLYVKLQTDAFKKMQTISNIVEIILAIPPSNAEVERVWSNVNHTLDDRSLSMGKDTLEYRIQIKRSKISLDKFDPTSAINLWWSDTVRCRRPNFLN